MRTTWLLAALLVLGGILWWALAPQTGLPVPAEEDAEGSAATHTSSGARLEGDGGALPGRTESGAARRGTTRNTTRPYRPRTGRVIVTPLGPDGEVIDPDGITVELEHASGVDPHLGRLARRDREAGTWTFSDVPIGHMRVRVHGPHWHPQEAAVLVRENDDLQKRILVDPAGIVAFTARFEDPLAEDEAPPVVTWRLRSSAGPWVAPGWRLRQGTHRTQRIPRDRVSGGSEGTAEGVRPGTYRLQGSTEDGRVGEATVRVVAGETVTVEVVLR